MLVMLLMIVPSVFYIVTQNYEYEKLNDQERFENSQRGKIDVSEEERKLYIAEKEAQFTLETSKRQELWLKRTRVEMRDTIINGRFVIAPLGISLDPATLPEGTAYSYYWNTSENMFVRVEVGKYDTGEGDTCFGLIELMADLDEMDENSRYPLKWMNELALNKKGVKKLDEKDFVVYIKPQDSCIATGLHYDEKEGYIFDSNGEKISDLGAQIERAIQSAEYVK